MSNAVGMELLPREKGPQLISKMSSMHDGRMGFTITIVRPVMDSRARHRLFRLRFVWGEEVIDLE